MATPRVSRKQSLKKYPESIKPMLSSLVYEPFRDASYIFEIKWDGYRIMAIKTAGRVKLASRSGHDYTKKYPGIEKALAAIDGNYVLDGEVVVLDEHGKPNFDTLQKFNGREAGAYYYVFDILFLEEHDLTTLPLLERKSILQDLVLSSDLIRFSEHFDDGIALFEQARALGLEGIVAKKKDSKYLQEKRGRDWLKIPTSVRQEFVIGGWVESNSGRPFRTLLFGVYADKQLRWVGHAGTGFKDHEMPAILRRLSSLEISSSPFVNEVDYDGEAHWVKPELVANIKYSTTTASGKIRKPAIFLGFRDDKHPYEVTQEVAIQTPVKNQSRSAALSAGSYWREVEAQKVRNKGELELEDCKVAVHNVDKVLWTKVTKGDLLQYYHKVSPYILPHLANRPLSLYLKLKGPHAPGVYIKDMEGREPECSEVFTTPRLHRKEGKRDVIDYLVCNNLPTLLYMIDLGCIDVNPWTSRTLIADQPDYVVIDLDPSDEDFGKAVDTAVAAHDLFKRKRIAAFPKTSGKTGIHLFLPCRGINFREARTIAVNICSEIHSIVPSLTTTEVSVEQRGNKLYLDPNQNDFADTVAAAYSVRPAKHPNVSAPLEWKEVRAHLTADDFNITTILKRLEKRGDLFMDVLDEEIALKNTIKLKRFL